MICLVFAMQKEAQGLLNEAELIESKQFGYTKAYLSKAYGKEFLIAISGIGKGFASSCIASICAHYEIEVFINCGVAGSQNKSKADIFSVVGGEEYVEHDLDTSAIGDPVGFISGINVVRLPGSKKWLEVASIASKNLNLPFTTGVISSGDTFLSNHADKEKITKQFGSLCLDMESAPYAQIAYVYQIPFVSLRVISDAEHPETEYAQNVDKCSALASSLALEIIKIAA